MECGAEVPAAAQASPPQMAQGAAPPPGMAAYAVRLQMSLSSIPLAEILVAVCALITTTIITSTNWHKLVEYENGYRNEMD